MYSLISASTPILFFTGKGGVGKTSTACATAIGLCDQGRRVLLVSTDPASNLDEVLGVALASDRPTEVPGVPGLAALNIDPEAAARAYRERVVGPYRGVLPDASIASIEEQLSGACTVEIAAFDQFARLLAEPEASAGFDHVVFDTAPTGHTLRLLELPAAWTGFFDTNTTGASCLGPLSGLDVERRTYAAALAALRSEARTHFVLVARPEPASLREAARTAEELRGLAITHLSLVINGVLVHAPRRLPDGGGGSPASAQVGSDDPVAVAIAGAERAALRDMPESLRALPRVTVPLQGRAPMGIDGLRGLLGHGSPTGAPTPEPAPVTAPTAPPCPSFDALVEELAAAERGVLLTMGKGGVGKTTVAARIAAALAARGHDVLLTTTDPAGQALDAPHHSTDGPAAGRGGATGRVRTSRIDPRAETARYTAHVLATAGAGLDAEGLALLEEDLRSPCTEEIAVFQAFAQTVAGGESSFVVIDTAPTGHTLLLLDAAEAYHREVLRRPGDAPEAVRELLPRLRDPRFARVLLVTLPEATPVHEAAQLQADLGRAGITPFAWVVNQALTGLPLSHPVLRERQRGEARYLAEVGALAKRCALVTFRPGGDPVPAAP